MDSLLNNDTVWHSSGKCYTPELMTKAFPEQASETIGLLYHPYLLQLHGNRIKLGTSLSLKGCLRNLSPEGRYRFWIPNSYGWVQDKGFKHPLWKSLVGACFCDTHSLASEDLSKQVDLELESSDALQSQSWLVTDWSPVPALKPVRNQGSSCWAVGGTCL